MYLSKGDSKRVVNALITSNFYIKSGVNHVEFLYKKRPHRAPVAQLVEHRAVMREVVSSTLAEPTLRVLK